MIIIVFVLLSISVTALKECKDVMKPAEVPCEIITTWDYLSGCETYEMRVYNQTPTFVYSTSLTNYTGTGRCNTTFNITDQGSYIFNISAGGDSGSIIVEAEMESAIAIVLTGFGILFFIIGFLIVLWRRKEE